MKFVTSSFNIFDNEITIRINDLSKADKGVYDLNIVFTAPGNYILPLGVEITIVDSCDLTTIETVGKYSDMVFTSQKT